MISLMLWIICINMFTKYLIADYCPGASFSADDSQTRCYQLLTAAKEPGAARDFCSSELHGELASIHNAIQNEAITKIDKNVSRFWIGVFVHANGNDYMNDDGSPFDYNNFTEGFSNGYNGNDFNCVYINMVDRYRGAWGLDICSSLKLPFLCAFNINITSTTSSRAYTTTHVPTTTAKKSRSTQSTKISISSTTTKSSTMSSIGNKSSSTTWIIIGVSLFIGAIIISMLIFCLFQIKRRNTIYMKKFAALNSAQPIIQKLEMTPLERHLSKEMWLTKKIESKNVTIDFGTILGTGTSGTVFKATTFNLNKNLFFPESNKNMAAFKVATKFEELEIEQFVRELDALIIIDYHPNIVSFLGWCLFGGIPGLLTELMEMNLLSYVQSLKGTENPFASAPSIILQISKALEYLAQLSMIHRDIACRNVLLTKNNVAKLSDFGLCCYSDEDTQVYNAKSSQPLPIRWLSIEALKNRTFSQKSDVWSFGVLCYEVYSYGAIPYYLLETKNILSFLEAENRLEKPMDVPDDIWNLVETCWKTNPLDRPSFSETTNTLKSIIIQKAHEIGYLELNDVIDLKQSDAIYEDVPDAVVRTGLVSIMSILPGISSIPSK